MTDLKAILQYQDMDIRLRRTLDSIDKSDAARRGKQAKAEFDTAKHKVDESEQEAGQLVEYFAQAEKAVAQIKQQIAECKAKLAEEGLTVKDRNRLKGELEGLKNKLSSMEKTIESKRKQASKVLEESRESQARAKKMRDVFLAEKENFDKLKQQKAADIEKFKRQLAELREKVDPELMAKYDELAKERKLPAFVDAYRSGATYSCRGCGLQLSQSDNSKLAKDGICRCSTCHRIIYIADK